MSVGARAYRAARLAHALHSASATPGTPGLWERLLAVPRLIRAVRSGAYTGLSSTRVLMLLAGVGYVVSPVDVVPEGLLLVLGLTDDVLVIGWVAAALVREAQDFLVWERHHSAMTVPSRVVD